MIGIGIQDPKSGYHYDACASNETTREESSGVMKMELFTPRTFLTPYALLQNKGNFMLRFVWQRNAAIRVPKEHQGDGRYRGETFAMRNRQRSATAKHATKLLNRKCKGYMQERKEFHQMKLHRDEKLSFGLCWVGTASGPFSVNGYIPLKWVQDGFLSMCRTSKDPTVVKILRRAVTVKRYSHGNTLGVRLSKASLSENPF